jgi:hypothetical protein
MNHKNKEALYRLDHRIAGELEELVEKLEKCKLTGNAAQLVHQLACCQETMGDEIEQLLRDLTFYRYYEPSDWVTSKVDCYRVFLRDLLSNLGRLLYQVGYGWSKHDADQLSKDEVLEILKFLQEELASTREAIDILEGRCPSQ